MADIAYVSLTDTKGACLPVLRLGLGPFFYVAGGPPTWSSSQDHGMRSERPKRLEGISPELVSLVIIARDKLRKRPASSGLAKPSRRGSTGERGLRSGCILFMAFTSFM